VKNTVVPSHVFLNVCYMEIGKGRAAVEGKATASENLFDFFRGTFCATDSLLLFHSFLDGRLRKERALFEFLQHA
jgi:hypothetical protein